MTYVSRDPFAREELHKRRVYTAKETCGYCGGVKHTPKGRTFLFSYWVEKDSGRKNSITGEFCSISCLKAFHNICN